MNNTKQTTNILLQPWLGLMLCLAFVPGLSNAQQDDFFGTIDVDIDSNQSDEPFSLIGWITQTAAYGLESPGPLFSRHEDELSKFETFLIEMTGSTMAGLGVGRTGIPLLRSTLLEDLLSDLNLLARNAGEFSVAAHCLCRVE